MKPEEKPVVLLIADISGFTRFMWAHRETLAHAQVLINELLGAVLREVELPMEVAKLEGDAVFLYMPRRDGRDPAEGALIGRKLMAFYEAFWEKLADLHAGNLCQCHACTNLSTLRLKIVVHTGSALFYTLGRFHELSGPDVITVHRLLKNSLAARQYILATDDAYRSLQLGEQFDWTAGVEDFADIGSTAVWIHQPGEERDLEQCPRRSWWHRFGREWVKYGKSLPYRLGLKPLRSGAAIHHGDTETQRGKGKGKRTAAFHPR